MKKIAILLSFIIGLSFTTDAQILSITPVFPTVDDTVTIVYDATQGNSALTGITPVYAHTGVITSASTAPNDWKYVQGNWGTADPNVVMTDLGNNLHEIKYHKYYCQTAIDKNNFGNDRRYFRKELIVRIITL